MSASKEFPIYVKTLSGSNTEVRVSGSDSVAELKKKVQEKVGVPVLRLLHKNKDLEDGKSVAESGVGEESIVIAIIETEKPCHFFFALDESGSMSGGRWNALIQSFVEFVDKRKESSAKNDIPIQDRITVVFHETHARFAKYVDAAGAHKPFDNVALADITSDSLVNDFKSGGNNFDHCLTFLRPHLLKTQGFVPVLLFMTDGGDCGDDDPRPGDFRQRAYNTMADIKRDLPDLRLYVTVVFTSSAHDIDGAKKLCVAGGADVSTNYTFIEDDGSSSRHSYPSAPHGSFSYASALCDSPLECEDDCSPADAPVALKRMAARAPMPAAAATPYTEVSQSSAQRKMASHWDNVYASNSCQAYK